MAVLCRSSLYVESKVEGLEGKRRERHSRSRSNEHVQSVAVATKRAGLHTASGCEPTHTNH